MNKDRIPLGRINIVFLLAVSSTYLLGAFFARFAGERLNALVYLVGFALIFGLYMLDRFYEYLTTSRVNLFSTIERSQRLKNRNALAILFFIAAVLMVSLFILMKYHSLQGSGFLWLMLIAVAMLVNLMQYYRNRAASYHWIAQAFIVSPLSLFFGASIQGLEPNWLLTILGFSLFCFYGSSSLVIQIADAQGAARQVSTFFSAVGWNRGVQLHHVLVGGGVVCLIAYLYFSNAWSSTWPATIFFLVSGFEVWLLNRISEGSKPSKSLLHMTALLQFFGIVYIMLLGIILL